MTISDGQNILCHVRNYLSVRQSEANTNGEWIDLCDAQRMIRKRLEILARLRARQNELERARR
jgi:hypothetical protein